MIYTFMNKNIELFNVEFEGGLAMGISNIREDKTHLLPVFIMPGRNINVSRMHHIKDLITYPLLVSAVVFMVNNTML